MVTLIWRTDLHFADQAPQSRTDDWPVTLLGKLAEIGKIAGNVKANAVLDGGDFFHLKSPLRNSHDLTRRAAEVHAAYPCPVYGNVGNHDVKYGSLEYLGESPLSVLFGSGVFKRLYDEHEAVFTQDGVTVRVVGIPYHGTKYDMNRITSIVKGKEDYLVCIAHMLASPSGGTMFDAEDVIKYNDLANLAPDVWCFGHWHKDQKVVEIGRDKWVVNIGSLSRGALTQDEMERQPCVAIMRFDKNGIRIDQRPLTVAPAKTVFDVEKRKQQVQRDESVEALVDSLKSVMLHRANGSILDEVRSRGDVPSAVRERTIDYLEQAGA